jgi:hypothetical protein
MAIIVKIKVIWVMTLQFNAYPSTFDGGSRFLQNISSHVQKYMPSYPGKPVLVVSLLAKRI